MTYKKIGGMNHIEALLFLTHCAKKWPVEFVRDYKVPTDSGSVFKEWLRKLYFW